MWFRDNGVLHCPPTPRPQGFPIRQQDHPRREPKAAHARQRSARVLDPESAVQRYRDAREQCRRGVPHSAVGSEDRGRSSGVEVDVVVEQGELHERHAHPHRDTGQDREEAVDVGSRGQGEPEHADGGEEGCDEDTWETFFGGDLAFPKGLEEDLVPARSESRFEEDKVDKNAKEIADPRCKEDHTGLLAGHVVEGRVDVWVRLR